MTMHLGAKKAEEENRKHCHGHRRGPRDPRVPLMPVQRMIAEKSHLGEECRRCIVDVVQQMICVEREVTHADKNRMAYLENKMSMMESDIKSYQE